jgi:hypothetical protein
VADPAATSLTKSPRRRDEIAATAASASASGDELARAWAWNRANSLTHVSVALMSKNSMARGAGRGRGAAGAENWQNRGRTPPMADAPPTLLRMDAPILVEGASSAADATSASLAAARRVAARGADSALEDIVNSMLPPR